MDTGKFKVQFCKNFDSIQIDQILQSDPNAILLSPVEDGWNDFGYRIIFTARIANNGKIIKARQKLLVAFLGKSAYSGDILKERLNESSNDWISTEQLPQFFTLLPSIADYRTLVSKLKPETAKEVLLSLNDLVTLRHVNHVPELVNEAIETEVFNLSFMRNSATFFAFHNAGSILDGLHYESLEGISKQLNLDFKLAAFENSHNIRFNFKETPPLPCHINVVIGKNGIGKSQTLNQIARALLSGKDNLKDESGNRPSLNKLLVITSPGETRNTFQSPSKDDYINYKRLHLSRSQWGKNEPGFGETLTQLSRTDEGIKGKSRWSLFITAIGTIIPPEMLYVKTKGSSKNTESLPQSNCFPLKDMQAGGERSKLSRWATIDPRGDLCRFDGKVMYPLSSGQITFIRFSAMACLHIENGTLLLFDEPETHLHPNLVTEFVTLLDHLLEQTGSHAIVATHSAYLVREVQRSQVIVLQQGIGNTIEAVSPRLRTLGADIGEISHFVFGDSLYGRLTEIVRNKLIDDSIDAEDLLEDLKDVLATEAWMYLRRKLEKGL